MIFRGKLVIPRASNGGFLPYSRFFCGSCYCLFVYELFGKCEDADLSF